MSELNILQSIKEFFPELYVDIKKYIEQLQQKIGELEKEIGQRTGENESLRKKIEELEKVVWAQDQFLIGYRISKKPPEKAFDILKKFRAKEQSNV